MRAECDLQAEREELEAVLSSEAFSRSPSVAQMLKYICERHFRGQSREIKEYNIAVEAFGRSPDFDQARDSIVRVEAHRLRKRLQEYYLQDGAGHQIQIILPPGNYIPQFIRREPPPAMQSLDVEPESASGKVRPVALDNPDAAIAPAPAEPAPPVPQAAAQPKVKRAPLRIRWPMLVLVFLVAFVVVFLWVRTRGDFPALGVKAPAMSDPVYSPQREVRILAGAGDASLVDHYGNTWSGDRYFHGGEERSVAPRAIANSLDPAVFVHRRQGNFTYDIPLESGTYELRLYFAETVFGENNVGGGGETTRVFRLSANGGELLPFLDVIADAGGSNTADIKVFKDIQPASDGMLHLAFLTWNNEVPFVNGIEIMPSRPGAIRPIQFLARETGYTDRNGQFWSSDRYFHNGVQVQRHDAVSKTEDETLYQNERFGNFTYVIPVAANSHYAVTMKFCESWFGPGRPARGGAGKRIFDISLNGRILLRDFDVFKEAGSLNALDKTFRGLAPNAQGKLIFTFAPSHNYAMINAIQVLDEAWK